MDGNGRTILVAGATGQQGSASARHLLEDGWRVRAVTRDASKPGAQALFRMGAEVIEANMEDRASLDRVLQGIYGVYSVQNFWLPGVGHVLALTHLSIEANAGQPEVLDAVHAV